MQESERGEGGRWGSEEEGGEVGGGGGEGEGEEVGPLPRISHESCNVCTRGRV